MVKRLKGQVSSLSQKSPKMLANSHTKSPIPRFPESKIYWFTRLSITAISGCGIVCAGLNLEPTLVENVQERVTHMCWAGVYIIMCFTLFKIVIDMLCCCFKFYMY